MTHIYKNNTGSAVPIGGTGLEVPGSGQITVDSPTKITQLAQSDSVIDLLAGSTPDLTYNDGTNDLAVSEALDRIKGFSSSRKLDITPDHVETFWNTVASSGETESTGIIIPDGDIVACKFAHGIGETPKAYTMLVFDYEGTNEKIFHVFRGELDDYEPDVNIADNQVEGDGTAKLQLVTINNDTATSGHIGGRYEFVKVN